MFFGSTLTYIRHFHYIVSRHISVSKFYFMISKYLQKKIKPYDPTKVKTIEDALHELQGCSFQGRNLGQALEVMADMVKAPNCLKVLTLSGALIPAGMEKVLNMGIELGVFNAIVTTGANIIHSIVNCFDQDPAHQYHYQGHPQVQDEDLHKHRINRIYDTFLPEKGYIDAEDGLLKIL